MTNPATVPLASATLPPRPALRRIVLLDVALPLLAVVIMRHNGAAQLTSYAAASLFPAGSVVASWFARRTHDLIGIGVLAGLLGALPLAACTGDPRFGLIRAAPAFALFGIACFVSLATPRPLMFYVARAFNSGGDPDRIAAFNGRLERAEFRQVMRRLTLVWGGGTLAHAALGVSAAFLFPASVALIVEPVLAFSILAALLAWTRTVQTRAARSNASRGD